LEDHILPSEVDERNELIVKSIELIQKTHYHLSVVELQAYSFILKKIDTSQPAFSEITFTYPEILEALGSADGGWQRERVKETLKALRDKSFWFWDKVNDVETTIGLVENVQIDRADGFFHVKMDDLLVPYLLQVQRKVEYPYWYSLDMGEYCVPLYELLASYLEQGKFTISLEKLRTTLNVSPKIYKLYTEFRRNVLEKSVDKINSVTDIQVIAETCKKNKKVTHIKFTVSLKKEENSSDHIKEEGRNTKKPKVKKDK